VIAYFAAPPIVYRSRLPAGYAPPADHQQLIDKATAEALGAVEKIARGAGVPCECVHSTSDSPDEEILKVETHRACGLIVMGSLGQGGPKGLLLGSVAQKVLGKATIPVMIVK
jgi:nucleotide-binding universal stress UspA family protein